MKAMKKLPDEIIKARKDNGESLAKLCSREKVTIKQLADAEGIKVIPVTVKTWFEGKTPIPINKLPAIRARLSLTTDSEYAQLWRNIAVELTPLDEASMPKDDYKHAGWLLKACQERCGVSEIELSYKLTGSPLNTIGGWKRGSQAIDLEYIPSLMKIFQTASDALPHQVRWYDDALAARFRTTCITSNAAILDRKKAIKEFSIHLGAKLKANPSLREEETPSPSRS